MYILLLGRIINLQSNLMRLVGGIQENLQIGILL